MTYYGPIKTKARADALRKKLRAVGTQEANAAASLLTKNWQSVAARPDLAARIVALAEGAR